MDARTVVVLLVGPVVLTALALASRAAGTGRLRRNHLVGIRLPSTQVSDEAWRAGHRAAIVPAWSWAAALIVAGVVVAILGASTTSVAALVVLLLIAVGSIGVVADRAARRTTSTRPPTRRST